ncbi:gp53-like domain-containing protein [Brucella cytisi]|uniref:gp53-like domain-containing protein n=1 Tax=Brucella cytisi TaxID=407152 RepID=UPI003F9F6F8D
MPGGSIVQWGRTQAATSSSTLLTIPLNTTFPVGIQTAIGINGDWTNSNVRTNTWVFYAPGSSNSQVSFATSAINQTVITCWVAFGR